MSNDNSTNKLNIAILFTGRIIDDPQQYNNFCEFFLTPLKDHHVDIFVSHSKGYTPERIQSFTRLYNPKCITKSSEKYIDTNRFSLHPEARRHNLMCMFLSRQNVLQLLDDYVQKSHIKYDLVISSRTDLWFKTPIPFQQFIGRDGRDIHVPEGSNWGGLNDQCAFGNLEEMRIYLSLYNEIVPLLESGVDLHPESLLKAYLDRKQITVRRFSTVYEIKRYGQFPNYL